MSDGRLRIWLFAALVVVCIVAGTVYVAVAARSGDPELERTAAAPARLPGAEDHLVFLAVDKRRGARTFGRLAWAPAGRPQDRVVTGLSCERVHFAGGRGLCLARNDGYPLYRVRVLDRRLRVTADIAVEGIPSRARVSPDGRFGAVTTFVSGHSYAQAGEFSTRTVILDLERGSLLDNVEEYRIERGGQELDKPDVNVWGVSFTADPGGRFYATVATGDRTYLVKGDVRARTASTVHENVECPSLSPDGTRVGYKKLVGGPGGWRFHVLDLETGRETALAEARELDDQIEWLDDEHVLYGDGDDVWTMRADGAGKPRRYLGAAASPASVRG